MKVVGSSVSVALQEEFNRRGGFRVLLRMCFACRREVASCGKDKGGAWCSYLDFGSKPGTDKAVQQWRKMEDST